MKPQSLSMSVRRLAAALFCLGTFCASLPAPVAAQVAAQQGVAADAGADLVPGDMPGLRPCPSGLGTETRCLAGRDDAGAWYWIAMPKPWNGVLVLHAHGGPELGPPKLERGAEDLKRWSVFPRADYAWAGSTFRQGGVAVGTAAEDTERLRGIFVDAFGMPRRTVLHGQSWGAGVAERGAEIYTAPVGGDAKRPPYDAVLLTSGVLGGGSRSYDFRLDLRVVWQAVCNNHPRPDEPQYPLWQGLPAGSKLTRAQLTQRIDECTGLGKPAAERSEEQARRLKTVLDVVKIPERSLAGHLAWATWHFQDIVTRRTNGRNPFGNVGVRYAGSADDALNDKVARYAADPEAVKTFGADTDPQGRIAVPVLTVHAIDDPVAFVELESTFRETMRKAGTADHLVQTFTSDAEHSYLSDVQYVAAVEALLGWVDRGEMPSPKAVAERCAKLQGKWGQGCRFVPDYLPAPLSSRVPAR